MTQRFPNKIFTLCFAAQVGRRMLSCASMLEMRKWSTCGEAQARLTQRTPSQLSSPGIVISHDFSWQIYPYICCFFLTYPNFSTKSLTAIAIASLYDEGLLDYETR